MNHTKTAERPQDETQKLERPEFELEHLDYLTSHGNGDWIVIHGIVRFELWPEERRLAEGQLLLWAEVLSAPSSGIVDAESAGHWARASGRAWTVAGGVVMELSRDDVFEVLGSTWLALEAGLLNEFLREHGVASKKRRQAIVTHFLCARGTLLDQGWFEAGGRRVHPGVCFTTGAIQPDTELSDPMTVFLGSRFYSHAEYASSSSLQYFEHAGESNKDIRVGVVAEQEDPVERSPRAASKPKRSSRKKRRK